MTCDDSRPFFHAYLDGELDAMQAAEFGRHMESVPPAGALYRRWSRCALPCKRATS